MVAAMGFSPSRLWRMRSTTSSRSARRSARYPSAPSFSLISRTARRMAHSALSSSSRIRSWAFLSSVGSSAIIRWASRMSPCSPSPRLLRIACSCSTDSFTAASSRAISPSICSGRTWNLGTRARRRSTGTTRPIATPGEAGMPTSFAKAPIDLSQAGELHLQAPEVLVHLEELYFSLLGGELRGQGRRGGLQPCFRRRDGRQPVQRAHGGLAYQELLFAAGLDELRHGLRRPGPPQLVGGASADHRVLVLELRQPAGNIRCADPRRLQRMRQLAELRREQIAGLFLIDRGHGQVGQLAHAALR